MEGFIKGVVVFLSAINVDSKAINNVCYSTFNWQEAKFERKVDVRVKQENGPLILTEGEGDWINISERDSGELLGSYVPDSQPLKCKPNMLRNAYLLDQNQNVISVDTDNGLELLVDHSENRKTLCFKGNSKGLNSILEKLLFNDGLIDNTRSVLMGKKIKSGETLEDFESYTLRERFEVWMTLNSGEGARELIVTINGCGETEAN